MPSFFSILKFAQPFGLKPLVYFFLVFAATVFSVFNLTAFIPLLQLLFGQAEISIATEPSFGYSIPEIKNFFNFYLNSIIVNKGRVVALYYLCSLIVISVLLANTLRYASQIILAQIRVRTIRNIRNTTFDALINKEISFYSSARRGDLIARMTADVQEIEHSVISTWKVLMKDPIIIIGYFLVLFSISPQLTFYTLLLVPSTGLIVSIIARKIKRWSASKQQTLGKISSVLSDTIGGIKVLRIFSGELKLKKVFSKTVNQYAQETYEVAKKTNLASPISEVVGTTVLALLLVIGGKMVIDEEGSLGPAEFIGFLIIFSQTLIPAKGISVAVSQINRGLAAGDRVFELTEDQPMKDNEEVKRIQKTTIESSIDFQSVSFSYDGHPVLQDIGFSIKRGQRLALVGSSGSGKTTISDLLIGLRSPDTGSVCIDGIRLSDIESSSWRQAIGVVTQEAILFHDTIANNIALGRDSADSEAIELAARRAHAHEFIMQLPDGYDSVIGESGDKLSGGERQRIAIARAILKNPQLLILDEATSSLDVVSEDAVTEAIYSLTTDRTTLIISHKPAIIKLADLVVLLDKGKIIDVGSPQELSKRSYLYNQLTE